MNKKVLFLTLLLLLTGSTVLLSQEICDNAIDDDGDGLIDLNDEDCICNSLLSSSLIPNPSFEDRTCCPMENERLDCAVGWIQASAPTTDYVHTCGGYLGNPSAGATAPLPFPDGEGGVGLRDGQAQVGSNYKEYVGACLTESMEIGVDYRLEFFVGFQDNKPGSGSFQIAIFGSTNCNNLPFGGSNISIGCPSNTGNYQQLSVQTVSGSNEWKSVVFEFTADQAYEVIVLGSSCTPNPNFGLDPYFYLDGLTLAESADFGQAFESISGSICENNLVLEVLADATFTYQWYQDGIALPGETNSSILLTAIDNTEGTYQVVITAPGGCLLSKTYELRIPPYFEDLSVNICENDAFIFGQDSLFGSGMYDRLVTASDGCDSIIQLNLTVLENSNSMLNANFCEGSTYEFAGELLEEAGTYQTQISNAAGCDSTIFLTLEAIDSGNGVRLDQDLVLCLGEQINLTPAFYDFSYTDFQWSDQFGTILSESVNIPDFRPTESMLVFLEASNTAGCSVIDSAMIEVTPFYEIYVPNAFSPNGDGTNDVFRFYPSKSVDQVLSFSVYNRWGAEVFGAKKIPPVFNAAGWDGNFKGEAAAVGVYTYVLQVQFIDGTQRMLTGDVTLLR